MAVAFALTAGCGFESHTPPHDADRFASKDADLDATVGEDASLRCPIGYTARTSTSCYRTTASGGARSWQAAEADCELAGAHLAVVDDPAEDAFVPDGVWIGLSETVGGDGVFRWVNGAPLAFTGWASGQPAPGGGLCTEARTDGWHDDTCSELKSHACEYDGVLADPATYQ